MNARPGKKTGPKPRFTRGDIVDAVLEIGLDTFTLGDVAAKLGVATSALYRHVTSRDEIIALTLERIVRNVRWDMPGETWQDLLRAQGMQFWDLCEAYPGLSRVIIDFTGSSSFAKRVIHDLLAELDRRGLSPKRAIFALDFIGDSVLIVHQAVSAMRSVDEEGRTGLERAYEFFSDQPADAALHPSPTWVESGSIKAKIELIIRGIESLPDEFFENTGL
ncbi:MAG: TetR/AcrR family transcriptional regulator [Flaviflexus sp.]|nr:TetR/AcrR family transcriptional regulator [Flaviflexus sp.]